MESVIDRIDIDNPKPDDITELIGELKKMREVDIRTVQKEDLTEAADVVIDRDAPMLKRVLSYIRQVRNPYCYLCNGVIVKVSMTGEKDIADCIREAMFGGGSGMQGI